MAAPWGPRDVFQGIVLTLVIAGGMLLIIGVVLTISDEDKVWIGLAGTALLDAVMLWMAWSYTVRKHGCRWSALGFRRLALKEARWALPAGLFASLTVAVVYAVIVSALGYQDRLKAPTFFENPTAAEKAAFAGLAIVLAPLVEETFFRGFVLRGLMRRMGFLAAAALASALFAVAHVDPVSYLPVFCIGMVLAWVATETGSLASSMLVHAAYNGVVVGLGYALD